MTKTIPSYVLSVEKQDLSKLKEDSKADIRVPAELQIGDTVYTIFLSYRGSYTRKCRKKSYFIEFKSPSFFSGSREIHLNAEFNDPSLIRNKLSFLFFDRLNVLTPDSHHITLTRNNTYKGIYLQLESVDELFIKKRHLPDGPIFYAVSNNANFSLYRDGKKKRSALSGYQMKHGQSTDEKYLEELVHAVYETHRTDFKSVISNLIDINQYLCWQVGAVCTMNNDCFTHNYSLYRNKETELFEIWPWDFDATWGRKVDGGIMKYNYVPISGKKTNLLSQRLLEVREFRHQYKQLLFKTLEQTFTTDFIDDQISNLHQSLRPHLLLDPYKKKESIQTFDDELDFIQDFIRKRRKYLKDHLKDLN